MLGFETYECPLSFIKGANRCEVDKDDRGKTTSKRGDPTEIEGSA